MDVCVINIEGRFGQYDLYITFSVILAPAGSECCLFERVKRKSNQSSFTRVVINLDASLPFVEQGFFCALVRTMYLFKLFTFVLLVVAATGTIFVIY